MNYMFTIVVYANGSVVDVNRLVVNCRLFIRVVHKLRPVRTDTDGHIYFLQHEKSALERVVNTRRRKGPPHRVYHLENQVLGFVRLGHLTVD